MAGKSRWADDEEDAALAAQRKREKEEKKRAKAEKQRQLEEAQRQREAAVHGNGAQEEEGDGRPAKRRRLSPSHNEELESRQQPRKLLRFSAPGWGPCRHVDNFERLNHIEEGSYGWVSRAKETATGEVVALKKLKMDNANDGFPVTALREIQTLKASSHRHIVDLREIVVGDALTDVFLVMEFLEHDLKTLQEDMSEPFLQSEVKTLLLQLCSAVHYLHEHWILHILMNNRGEIKLADFGMARYIGDPPPPNLTQLVVTLWYRSPELLLGTTTYSTPVDVWSIGCIFGELLTREPLLQGKNEVDQLSQIFCLCGIPTEETWPSFRRLPNAKTLRLPRTTPQNTSSVVRSKFPTLTSSGAALLSSMLALNPAARPSASEILSHPYFQEDPRPKSTAMFPTFPSKAGQEKRRRRASPNAPRRGAEAPKLGGVDFGGLFAGRESEETGAGFQLKLV